MSESNSNPELERRRAAAVAAIEASLSHPEEDCAVALFVQHHLAEVGDDYWMQHCQDTSPSANAVIGLLVLQSHWTDEDEEEDAEDGLEILDFTLPGEITQYVLSVQFDDRGNVEDISMES